MIIWNYKKKKKRRRRIFFNNIKTSTVDKIHIIKI